MPTLIRPRPGLPPRLGPRPMPVALARPVPARPVCLIGVATSLGGSAPGVALGPAALRVAGVKDALAELGLHVSDADDCAAHGPAPECADLRDRIAIVAELCARLSVATCDAVRGGAIPLILGGDHSITIGSVAGVANALGERGEALGVVWLDAHADINTPETTRSGKVHGMPVAHMLGMGDERLARLARAHPAVQPQHLAYVGLRDVEPAERELIRTLGIRAFTMRDIDARGIKAVMADAIAVASSGTGGYHVSLDMDWVDPREARGVGTPVPGGATSREAHLAMEMLHEAGGVVSMDLVEVDPTLDDDNRTARLAVSLAASALGRRIL